MIWKTLIKVESARISKEKETKEIRYCIGDKEGLNASCFNARVRGRRGIENHLHRHLPDWDSSLEVWDTYSETWNRYSEPLE
jgi:hypothetical protein